MTVKMFVKIFVIGPLATGLLFIFLKQNCCGFSNNFFVSCCCCCCCCSWSYCIELHFILFIVFFLCCNKSSCCILSIFRSDHIIFHTNFLLIFLTFHFDWNGLAVLSYFYVDECFVECKIRDYPIDRLYNTNVVDATKCYKSHNLRSMHELVFRA